MKEVEKLKRASSDVELESAPNLRTEVEVGNEKLETAPTKSPHNSPQATTAHAIAGYSFAQN